MSRFRRPMPMPPPMKARCWTCNEKNAPFGIGPPLAKVQRWYCGTCLQFTPAAQQQASETLADALQD